MNPTLRPAALHRGPAVLAAITLIALAIGFRLLRVTLLPALPNFSPIMALAVCGALVLPGRLALVIPLVALAVTDLALNFRYGVALFSPAELLSYACYAIGVASGLGLGRRGAGSLATLGVVGANSVLFYVVTNSVCWLDNPAYAKTAAGWLQALTVGVPGFPPTWSFFGTSLASDLLFTGGFLVVMHLLARESSAATPVAARA
jgi:hypothetical protein